MDINELNLPLLDKETLIKLLVSIDSENSRLFETVENLRADNRELKNTVANIKEYVADSYGLRILHAKNSRDLIATAIHEPYSSVRILNIDRGIK